MDGAQVHYLDFTFALHNLQSVGVVRGKEILYGGVEELL